MENELRLHVAAGGATYYLRADRMVSADQLTSTRYIERPDNFEGCLNIVEVTGIFDSEGNELVMNNRFSTPGITQLSMDTLKFTKVTSSMVLNVVYQASPTKIILDDDFNPEEDVLHIPDTIIEALLYYVASRIYKPTGANNSTANADKSISYQQQYELSCQKIDLFGLTIQNCDSEDKFESEGWA
jgi:hypothetical protein